jgi:hypothetical protein
MTINSLKLHVEEIALITALLKYLYIITDKIPSSFLDNDIKTHHSKLLAEAKALLDQGGPKHRNRSQTFFSIVFRTTSSDICNYLCECACIDSTNVFRYRSFLIYSAV